MELPPLSILYEDNHCLAVNKPAGVLTTGYTGGEETLDRQVKQYLKEKHQKPGNVFLGVVHRLDRPATGVLLFARNSKSAGRLAEQFREGQTTKLYWVLVAGQVEPRRGSFEDWLWKDHMTGYVQVLSRAAPEAKYAKLDYERLGQVEQGAWLAVQLHTGRTHQIRVQFSHRGNPVWGDQKYGSERPFPLGIALHARSLTFLHPIRYEPITLTAPLPESWEAGRKAGFDLPKEEAADGPQ